MKLRLVIGLPWWLALPVWALQVTAWLAVWLVALTAGAAVFVAVFIREWKARR